MLRPLQRRPQQLRQPGSVAQGRLAQGRLVRGLAAPGLLLDARLLQSRSRLLGRPSLTARAARRSCGLTFPEIMLTVALLGLLSTMAIVYSTDISKREESLAVAMEFASWLEQIQRQAFGVPGGCMVEITAARNDPINNVNQGTLMAPGDQLAKTWPNSDAKPDTTSNACSGTATFTIPAAGFSTGDQKIFRIAANRPAFNNGKVWFSFTPRGGIDSLDRILVRIQRAPFESAAQPPAGRSRSNDTCVRIDRTSGMVGIGHGECAGNKFDDQN